MPNVYPFRAVQYSASGSPADVTKFVAPPYDVLDSAGKAALLKKDARNIVGVDLPHIPAKQLGPAEVYEQAAATYRGWLKDGTLKQLDKPAMFVYRQRFTAEGKTYERTGMCCTVETLPLGPRDGGGILPHEQTFSGPKEDRLALMKASACQFSPIFGLHADESGAATNLCRSVAASRKPDVVADLGDGDHTVRHEVWVVDDTETLDKYVQALAGEDVFIADGHHRYNTALNYLLHLEGKAPVPADHAARRCMIVLVGMSDPGLAIWPTHRVLGGMKGYSFDAFQKAAAGTIALSAFNGDLHALEKELNSAKYASKRALGFYDFASKKGYLGVCTGDDPLASSKDAAVSGKPKAWRELDVAIIQHLVVEQICQPSLNAGEAVQWAFPHSIEEVLEIGEGAEKGSGGGKSFVPQLCVVVRPTPLEAVKAISRANELMPQKSTFFYPKLATGLFLNPLGKA